MSTPPLVLLRETRSNAQLASEYASMLLGNSWKSHQPSGRRWSRESLFSSKPLLPLRGGVYPSPYPLPLRSEPECLGVSGGLFVLKMVPRWPYIVQDGLHDGTRYHNMAQDGLRYASKRRQDRHKTASSGHGASQGYPRDVKKSLKTIGCSMILACPPFRVTLGF